MQKVAVAKEKLKEARTRQKSYADKHRRALEFQPGDHVFLKVSLARGVRRFGIKGKLSPRFIEPFEILDRVDLSYVEEPEAIIDRQDRIMRKKTIPLSRFFGGTIPSGKPLGKPRSLSGLLILISFHDMSERTIQTLEDMLRSCALEWTGSWDDYICLVEFAYNNSWHASIKCAPFEMLYGRKCRAPICWDQIGERSSSSVSSSSVSLLFKMTTSASSSTRLTISPNVEVFFDLLSVDVLDGVMGTTMASKPFPFDDRPDEVCCYPGYPCCDVPFPPPADEDDDTVEKAWGTRLKFSTAFHPQTDGQSECTIQTLEDMLCSCALEWTGNWDNYICLVEFAYNNSWHASIKCAPFEMLYGRKCRAPICWDQVGERVIEGPEMIEVTNAKVAVAKEKLKEAHTR
uniref:Putative nucleotidyltransferase, ribonuclease H n=1 Tax=Tanacetum cinerariifolium TaxID=118510 RepID=A0A6L2LB47_TANCI|nr:putative nucleotidyltransferase, ribonuclease H [Tanacetum cinerariifolium]